MPRHIVCLSYDFDTQSGFIARGMTTPAPLARGEFGALASRRILHFLAAQGIPCVYWAPGDITNCHTTEEHVDAGELVDAVKALSLFLIAHCGTGPTEAGGGQS